MYEIDEVVRKRYAGKLIYLFTGRRSAHGAGVYYMHSMIYSASYETGLELQMSLADTCTIK